MTMPVEKVTIECPKCRTKYETGYRGSFNLELDPWVTEEYIREMTTGTCPSCGMKVDIGALVVSKDGTFEFRGQATRPR